MIMIKNFKLMMVTMLSLVLLFVAGCGSSTEGKANTAKTPETAAASKAEDVKKPIEIDFWHIQATIYGEAIKEIVDEFNKEYEGKIIVKETFQGSYDDLNKKVRAALQGGGLPVIAMAYESDTLEYMKADKIVPLDSYINDPDLGLSQEELNDIMPGVLARQRIAEYEGKTMSWPHGNSSMGTYYNIDLLKKAGFDKPAETWKEFEQQAITIYEKTGVPALVMGTGLQGGTFYSWLKTFGIEPIAPDASSVNYDNPQALELLSIIKNLIDKKVIVLAENTEQEFTNGRAAMEISTTARTSSKLELIQNNFQWGITLVPQGDTNEKRTTLYGGNQIMFKGNPDKEEAGWTFLKYFAGPKAQAIYAAKTGYFPATLSSQDTDLLKKNYADNPQKAQAFEEVFPYATIGVSTSAKRVVDDAVGKALEMTLTGSTAPAESLKAAQSDAVKALKEFK